MKVRSFKLSDYPAVTAVWSEAGLEFRPGDGVEEIRVKIQRDPELFLVAEDRGKVVGSVMGAWDGRRGWIYHLGVLPRYQRKRVATKLVRELESRMKKKGVLKVNALIFAWNDASIEFFSKSGYFVADMKEAQKSLTARKR
ncbi:MAG: GNAT family N-acetyltransferase [Thaumarchaeota archaeon]|nr:GNAT family N-acetyltransferase [Nitrososphaerota archaeon]